jgi:lambda family phage portal protein
MLFNGIDIFNQGYAGAGGSVNSQALAGFNSWSGTATGDLYTRRVLVSRSRQLAISQPMAAAVIDRMTGGIIGSGLKYQAPESSEFIDNSIYADLAKYITKKFKLSSHIHAIDAQGILDFYQMQELACRNWLLSGDIFFVRFEEKWRSIESDRCISPILYSERSKFTGICYNPDNGNRIIDGVEIDSSGVPIAYWFLKDYITTPLIEDLSQIERIPAYDPDGYRVVLHLYKPVRPDQYRGIPILADIIESLHNLKNYTQAELQAAQFQSAIWGFLTSENPAYDETDALSDYDLDRPINTGKEADENTVTMQISSDNGGDINKNILYNRYYPEPKRISAGQFMHLKAGEDVKFLQSTHPNNNYSGFMTAHNGQIASAVGIPRQVLECAYDGTYASARGSVLEANRTFKNYRSFFINTFVRPVFERFVYDTLKNSVQLSQSAGEIAAAMSIESIWQAPTALCLDPAKELDAWNKAILLGLVDKDEAAQALYGHKATGTEDLNETKDYI